MSTAYVFNGYKPLIEVYAGLPFRFPYNEVTHMGDQRFTSPDERRQNHESNPEAGAIFETKVDAIAFVTDLMNRHYQGYQTEGVVWIGDHEPTAADKKNALERGRVKKMKFVEQCLADRRVAMAKGGQPEMDHEVVEWMKEYGISDSLYNPTQDGGLTEAQLAQVGAIAGAVMAQMQKQPEPVQSSKR